MATPIAFESAWVKKEEKQKLREARQDYLEKAKRKYEKEEKKRELAKQRGDDTWMLDSVSNRIDKEREELDKIKSKKHKKEKKRKKHKKEKRKKDEKRHKSSDSESESCDDGVWVEQQTILQDKGENSGLVKGPQIQRDSWMQSPLDLIPTITREEIRKAKIEQDKAEKAEINLLDQPGKHPLELNPYWKDGGTGLPEEAPSKSREAATSVRVRSDARIGDSGVSWLRKAYLRCQQQAKDENRALAEVAAERWGSLEKLEKMLADAESSEQENLVNKVRGRHTGHERRKRTFVRPRSGSRERQKSRSRERNRSRSRDRKRSRSRERKRSLSRDRKRSRSRERNRSRDRYRSGWRKRSRSQDRRRSKSSERKPAKSSRFLKPREDESSSAAAANTRDSRHDRDRDTNLLPAWKKKSSSNPIDSDIPKSEEKHPADRKPDNLSPAQEYSSEDSDSNSSSEGESHETGSVPATPVLTDQQMNELGAKILRAEIMGDEDLAKELKDKIASAQKAREERKTGAVNASEPEENVAVLTRTDKRGMVRPLPERQHPVEPKAGRRKAQKAQTHSDGGQRQKYFDDDDKFDLKTLVEREKMGTAEDQNAMFARLAGRAAEKTDDDFQVDDMFIKNASKKQNDSRTEERERTLAITEHKKMSDALEKCQFCFDHVAKHLIIAIGQKVYLSLPNHRSLTEGHCLIVPMQHVSAGTAVDEDVWSEIQVFRKALTNMFQSMDEDCVFMESAMYLKKFPHMSVECVPLPKELGDMAPIYFKKAILDSETEWAQNKKVVDLSNKDVRRAVPKGFPYFSVDFGLQGGFAHVIEDEQRFTTYFGKEVIGGMIDAEPRLWRKPWRENFEDQRKKVLQFAEWWKPYDWTQNLDK